MTTRKYKAGHFRNVIASRPEWQFGCQKGLVRAVQFACCVVVAAGSLFPEIARAQSASDTASSPVVHLDDVVVDTAGVVSQTSREQLDKHQDKPVASNVVTEDQIRANQITNLLDAQRFAPSVQLKSNNYSNNIFNIRGFGNATYLQLYGIYSGSPVYLDGVYLQRPGALVTDVVGLNGVEVLKGPQSTAGGWDSTGGALYLTTAPPSFTPKSSIEASVGNYNYKKFVATTTGPIAGSDSAAFSLSYQNSSRDGFVTEVNNPSNKYYSSENQGVRGQILLKPNDDFTDKITGYWSKAAGSCCVMLLNGVVTNFANGAPVPNNFNTRAARFNYSIVPNEFANNTTDVRDRIWDSVTTAGISNEAQYDLNGWTLSSLTAFNTWNYTPYWHGNAVVDIPIYDYWDRPSASKSVQQEFKVSTPKGERVEVTSGLFYFYEKFQNWDHTRYGSGAGSYFGSPAYLGNVNNLSLNSLTREGYGSVTTNSIAPFTQAVWHVTPQLDLTGGLRYSFTRRSGSQSDVCSGQDLSSLSGAALASAISQRASLCSSGYSLSNPGYSYGASSNQGIFSNLASISYKVTPDIMTYGTFSQGGRPGGPNISISALPAGAPSVVEAETLTNYEVGLKTSWLNKRLTINAAAFWMNSKNYIVTVQSLLANGTTSSFLANAAGARSRGFELDIRAEPIEGLRLNAAGAYTDAVFTDFKNAPCPYETSNTSSICDLTGKPLSLVPKWVFTVGGEYQRDLDFRLPGLNKDVVGIVGADYVYQTKFYSTVDNSIYGLIDGYGLLNLHAGFKTKDESWSLTGWVRNALNKHYWTVLSASTNIGAGTIGGNPGLPLMAGVTARAQF